MRRQQPPVTTTYVLPPGDSPTRIRAGVAVDQARRAPHQGGRVATLSRTRPSSDIQLRCAMTDARESFVTEDPFDLNRFVRAKKATTHWRFRNQRRSEAFALMRYIFPSLMASGTVQIQTLFDPEHRRSGGQPRQSYSRFSADQVHRGPP